MKRSLLLLALGTAGCGFFDQGEPRVLAHRAGGRYWPENSQQAIRGSIAEGFAGIEVDVRLTADHVPVLVHDPHLDPELCTRVGDDEPIAPDTIAVHDLTYAELVSDFRCGGSPPVSLAQLAELVRDAPEMHVMFDVKSHTSPFTPAEIVESILGVWLAADLPNPWFVAASNQYVVRAFTDWERSRGRDVEAHYMILIDTAEGAELVLGLHDHLEIAWSAGADGMLMDHTVLNWNSARDLRSRGMRIGVMGVRDRDLVDALSGWPIDYILTDAAREVQDPEM